MENEFCLSDPFISETGAQRKIYHKGNSVIQEGERCCDFLFLVSGELSVNNFTDEGKEFLQHKVIPNHFFGEPAVLLQKPFLGNVEVLTDKAEILRINRERFLEYMAKNPADMLSFTKSIAQKSINKSRTLKNIVFQNPEERICNQLRQYKKECGKEMEKMQVKLTRKEISNMTGLRIETIIRTVKKMEKEGKLEIQNGKIYY